MSEHDEGDRSDDRIDDLVRDLAAPSPSPGFAARTAALAVRRARARRVARWSSAIIGAVAVAATLLVVVTRTPASGDVTATARETVALGSRALAVLEPSAALTFSARDALFAGGAVDVEQRAGRAFYRVDKGTPLTVHTSAGDVVVHGTCFTVSLEDQAMAPVVHSSSSSSKFKTAALGALAGAVLSVAVLEGAVHVTNANGDVAVGPGQTARATSTSAPSVAPTQPLDDGAVHRLRAENEDLKAALDNAQHAAGGDVQKLVAENRELREKLRHEDEELALNDADRSDKEGKPRAFPKDLAPRFTQQELLKSFTDALKQAGIDGNVSHIDCDEFPCIVYGDVKAGTDIQANNLADKLKDAPALAQYKDDEDNNSWWRSLKKGDDGKTEENTMFGIAVWPKSENGDNGGDDIAKRIGFRNQQMWDAMKPAKR